MKQFAVIFGAVLCALIAAGFILYGWLTVSTWETQKSTRLTWIANIRQEIAKDHAQLDNYQSQGDRHADFENKLLTSRALESEERLLARRQLELQGIFDDKPWFLTPSEREQQRECARGVEEYQAKNPGVDVSLPVP